MERDIVRRSVDFIIGCGAADVMVKIPCALYTQVRVTADNLHTQPHGCIGNHTADGTQSDNAQHLAFDFVAGKAGLAFLHRFCGVFVACQRSDPLDAVHNITGGKQQGAQRQFLDAVGIGTGRIEHHNACLCAGVQRNVVDAGARPRDGKQLRVEVHLQHVCRTHHNAVRRIKIRPDCVQRRVEPVGSDLGNLIQKQYVFHDSSLSPCAHALGLSAANFFMNATSASTPS